MPLYNFTCTACGPFKKIFTAEEFPERKDTTVCPKCKSLGSHVGGAATSQTMEVLDNGLMARRVERLSEAERIFKEREVAHEQKFGKTNDLE